MTIRSRDSAAPERAPWVAPDDWQDAFAPEPDRTPPRRETPAAPVATMNVWSRTHDAAAPSSAEASLAEFDPQVDHGIDGRDASAPEAAGWSKRGIGAALVCAAVVAAGGWFLVLQPPAAQRPMIGLPAPPADAANTGNQPAPPAAAAAVAAPEVVRRSGPRLPDAATTSEAAPPVRKIAAAGRVTAAPPQAGSTAPRLAAIPTPEVTRAAPAPPSANEAPPVDISPMAAPEPTPAAPAPADRSRLAATQVAPDPDAVPPGSDLEIPAIENALGRYRNAFNTLNARAVVAVWPTVNEKALARAFESLDGQNVSFHECQIETADVRAVAVCSGTARYVPKVGYRARRPEPHRWRFNLHKGGSGWLIDRVEARPFRRGQ